MGFLSDLNTSFYVIPLKSFRPSMNSTIVRNKHPTYESRDICNPYPNHTGVALGTKEVWNCNSLILVYLEWYLHVHRQIISSISKTQIGVCACYYIIRSVHLISTFSFPEIFNWKFLLSYCFSSIHSSQISRTSSLPQLYSSSIPLQTSAGIQGKTTQTWQNWT